MESLPFLFLVCLHAFFLFVDAADLHTTLTLGSISSVHTTKCLEYGYFKVAFDHPCDDLNILVKRRAGEPNLYVSLDPYPTYRSLAWSSYEWGSENVTISSWEPHFRAGIFYIGVHSYCGDDVITGQTGAEYTILVQKVPSAHPKNDLFSKQISDTVAAKSYKYYRFCIPSPCYKVEVQLENCIDASQCPTTYSWPELIISATEERPTEKSMAWILAEVEHRSITLDTSDKNVKPGHFYVGVYGWCTPADKCKNKAVCGPCEYARETYFNLSVIATDTCSTSIDASSALSPSLMLIIPQLVVLLVSLMVLRDY